MSDDDKTEGNPMVRLAFGLLLGLAAGYLLGTRGEIITTLKRQRASRSELDSLSRDELYKRAQAEDLAGRSSMNKEELHDALVPDLKKTGEEIVSDIKKAGEEIVDSLTGRNDS